MAEGWQIRRNYPEFRSGIPSFDSSCCVSRGIFLSWRSCTPNTIPSNACLEFVLDFLNSKIIFSNFLEPPDGRILKNATLSTGIPSWNSNMRFLLLCKSRVEFCFAFLELENYFFKFSWPAECQDIKKCHAINWNSVIEFQCVNFFVMQVTGGILFCISWIQKLFLEIFLSRQMSAH